MLTSSKVTCSVVQQQATTPARNPLLPPQGTDNQNLTISLFVSLPYNFVQPNRYQGMP